MQGTKDREVAHAGGRLSYTHEWSLTTIFYLTDFTDEHRFFKKDQFSEICVTWEHSTRFVRKSASYCRDQAMKTLFAARVWFVNYLPDV
jgi:hypothetical protein